LCGFSQELGKREKILSDFAFVVVDRPAQEMDDEWEDSGPPGLVAKEESHKDVVHVAIALEVGIGRPRHSNGVGLGKRNELSIKFNVIGKEEVLVRGCVKSWVPAGVSDEIVGEVEG
jgi:hypothetical protein